MDRTLVYPSQQPTDTLWLNAERNKVISLGWLAQGVLGTNTVADGLLCTATSPASMAVNIGAGAIYSQTPLDSVAYGSLGVDTVDQIIKQGVILATSSLTLTPPATSGQAINYLIEAELVEQDTNSTVLSYFNSATPTVPFTGPAGSGVAQPTLRQCTVALVAKAGVAATAGSQVTPTPDAGYVGLWVVTVANGQTTITSANISQYSAAPFLSVKLPQLPAWVQGGTYGYAADSGTANALSVTLTPAPTTIAAGFQIRLRKSAAASTGAMTIAVNGASPVTLAYADGTPMSSTQVMPANFLADLTFDGTSWRFMNGLTSSAVGSLTASSGEGTAVTGGGSVALNYPGLSIEPALANTDLWAFYSQADAHHRVVSWSQMTTAIQNLISAGLNLPKYYSFDESAPPSSPILLNARDRLTVTFTNVASVPLHTIAAGGIYRLHLAITATNSINPALALLANDTQYSGAFSNYTIESQGSTTPYTISNWSAYGGFLFDYFYEPSNPSGPNDLGPSLTELTVSTFTSAKMVKHSGTIKGGPSIGAAYWNDTTTAWSSLGTLIDPNATLISGVVTVERLA